jgi:rare lipoprotein A
MTLRGKAGLFIVLAAILQAGPIAAAPRERSGGTVIEIAPRAAPREPADRSGKARQTQAKVLDDPALANLPAVGVSGVLPQGTTARVQNLENGRSTFIQVPPVARALGVTGGSAQVLVAPLAVPQPDGTIRIGEGSRLTGAVAAPALSQRPEN